MVEENTVIFLKNPSNQNPSLNDFVFNTFEDGLGIGFRIKRNISWELSTGLALTSGQLCPARGCVAHTRTGPPGRWAAAGTSSSTAAAAEVRLKSHNKSHIFVQVRN